jgi:hypothetical protein
MFTRTIPSEFPSRRSHPNLARHIRVDVPTGTVPPMDMRIEVVIIPVSDVQRAKEFYLQAGFVCDTDQEPSEQFRVV